MPFERYGVLAGVLQRHFRDRPDDQGRWFHVNLRVDALAGRYKCAVDVDSKSSATGVQWKVFVMEPVAAPASGYHELKRMPGKGALDLLRHAGLALDAPWQSGSFLEASAALEPILVVGRRILVFGEPFDEGLGMHNVHQNQGDPYGSQWWDENGIWQDGGTVTVRPDGRLDVFVSKFSTQAGSTDDDGHPVVAAP